MTKTKTRAKAEPKIRKRKADDPQQFERFVETARKLGVDETGETFERAFKRVVTSTTAARKRRDA